jgi:RNA polymerase sigma-70 factor (ECF subfamily)
MVDTRANGSPAHALYLRGQDGLFHANSVDVLTLVDGRIARIVAFNDPALVPTFGLPTTLPAPVSSS